MSPRVVVAAAGVLLIAALLAMTGRGGGSFYVPLLVAAGASMRQVATSGQLILVATALAALIGHIGQRASACPRPHFDAFGFQHRLAESATPAPKGGHCLWWRGKCLGG